MDDPRQFARPPARKAGDEQLKLGPRTKAPDADPADAPVKEKPKPYVPDSSRPKIGPLDAKSAAAVAAVNVEYGLFANNAALITAIRVRLPELHPKQLEIKASPAKRKVINCGRRVGKTFMGAWEAVDKMCDGRRVLLASTTQEQADAFWEYCKRWLEPFTDGEHAEIKKNETRRTLEMESTGGRIRVKTASDADTLRGDFADFLILDECAMLAPNAWNEVGAPMLLDNGGDAWFLSTPRRRNWFFGLYQRAISDDIRSGGRGRWAYFHATSYDNPHLDAEALEEIVGDLDDDAFQQEIMAVFLEGEGAVFHGIDAALIANPNATPEMHRNHFIVIGNDWGQRNDYTVNCVFCATCMEELFIERFNRMKWAVGRDKIVNVYHLWGVSFALAESNSIGGPNIEALHDEDGLNIEGLDMNKKTKPQVIRGLSLCIERIDAKWLPYPVGKAELEAYEAVVSRITGHVSYSAPRGVHDDTVIARGLALYAAMNGMKAMAPGSIPYTELSNVQGMDDSDSGSDQAAYLSYAGGVGYNMALEVPAGRPF